MRYPVRVAMALLVGAGIACQLVYPADPLSSGGIDGGDDLSDGGIVSDGGGVDSTGPSTCDADLATSDDNCGACGRTCRGAGCVDGGCNPKIIFDGGVADMTYADGFVYWTEQGADGGVWRHEVDSGISTRVVGGQSEPQAILAANGSLFWATQGTIEQALADGGARATLVSATGAGSIQSLAVTRGYLLWVNSGKVLVATRIVTKMGVTTPWQPLSPPWISADESDLVFVHNDTQLTRVTIETDASYLAPSVGPISNARMTLINGQAYFTNTAGLYMQKAQSPPIPIGSPVAGSSQIIQTIAGDAKEVFFAASDETSGYVYRCPSDTCAKTPFIFDLAPGLNAMAVSPDWVFVYSALPRTIYRVAR